MELVFSQKVIIMIIISLIFMITLLQSLFGRKSPTNHNTKQQEKPRLPPGSKGLPLVGETLEFLSYMKSGNPDKYIEERMKRHSTEVFRASLFGDNFVVMSGSKASKFLLSNDTRLVRSWWPRSLDLLFSSLLQESFKLKNIATVFVKPGGLKGYVGVMDRIARNQLLSQWEGNHQVTVAPLTKSYAFAIACKLLLSIEEKEVIAKLQAPFSSLALGLFSLPLNLPGTPLNRAIKAAKDVKKQLVEIIRKRREDMFGPQCDEHRSTKTQSSGDILSHLMVATSDVGERMTDLQITDRITGILIAAHDTTSSVITITLKYLADHPRIYDAVFEENAKVAAKKADGELLNWEDIQEMKYIWNFAREVMRVWPPAQGLFREAMKDFVYDGYLIPKGWKVYLSVSSTRKDSRSFVEPEKFDPSRFQGEPLEQYTYLPFGGGTNMCQGKNFAQLEILVYIHNVVNRFRLERIDPDEKIIVYPMPVLEKGLPVRLYPH